MKSRSRLVRSLVLVPLVSLAALAVFIPLGCEEDTDDLKGESFYISPNAVTMSAKEKTASLKAVGGLEPLTWSVSDVTLGNVSGEGQIVNYTRTDVNGVNKVRVKDSRGWTAAAVIKQQEALTKLTISPTSATLDTNGDKVVFTGAGGVGPYRWSVGNSALGSIRVAAWSQCTYTRKAQGNNTVTVTDKNGHVAVAKITQPGAPVLNISPAGANVSTNGGTIIFTASGGTGNYQWSFQTQVDGSSTIAPATGASSVYTLAPNSAAGTDVVRLQDGISTVFAPVNRN